MNTLFSQQINESQITGHAVGIAVNANVWDSYTYLWPDSLGEPAFGQRVRVPFGRGNRKITGFVIEPNQPAPADKILKTVTELIDHESLLTEDLKKLCLWINRYYLTPLGMTLAAMLPTVVGTNSKKQQIFVTLQSQPTDWPSQLGKKQRTVLDELLEAKKQGIDSLSLEELLHHSKASRQTVHSLAERNLISTETRPLNLEHLQNAPSSENDITLNDDQQAVLEKFLPRLNNGFSVTLLRGVTGSGKTEIYVRAIRRVIEAGKQAILLAPEIALATQTLQRLLKRLPRVAVLHSGLSAAQRAFYWQQIRDGHAGVVVGPRSAVFAPIRPEKLGLVVVD
ncbi:MAG TPA: DEAD/DEAH box helicase, partial [Phycisphaerae bacterium]|nr:DEAD/DEAH box helicase [Phycisphaerae bacterium]